MDGFAVEANRNEYMRAIYLGFSPKGLPNDTKSIHKCPSVPHNFRLFFMLYPSKTLIYAFFAFKLGSVLRFRVLLEMFRQKKLNMVKFSANYALDTGCIL